MSDPKAELKAQYKIWNKKLKASGFKDIEADGRDTLTLFHSEYYKENYSVEEFKGKERYFQLASQLLHEFPFANAKDKKIWQLHSEGMTVEAIRIVTKVSHRRVQYTIERVAKCIKS